jgi:3-oxoacyl-[acyl-carrier protein] reductase
MTDRYLNMMQWSINRSIAKKLGLPQPIILERYSEGNDFLTGNTLFGHSDGAIFTHAISNLLSSRKQLLITDSDLSKGKKLKSIIFDASGVNCAEKTYEVCEFFSRHVRSLGNCARVVVIGLAPDCCSGRQGVAQYSLLGFVKSFAKEMRAGGTVNLLWCHPNCGTSLHAPLSFLASDRSAYVSGQAITARPAAVGELDFNQPLSGKCVIVTGAARGIGRAIAELLSFRGATVTLVDVPASLNELESLAKKIKGNHLTLDITAPDAAQKIIDHFHGKLFHGIVHNAGITRDKKLANMSADRWDAVIRTNWSCQEAINQALIDQGVIGYGGRIVLVSSISGIGGNAGQTNYSTSKAAVIGMVQANATEYIERGITINAVAPGFIETQMVKTIPMGLREAGRRLNSLAQGGQPIDVAEAIGMFLQPSSQGVWGNVLRVCGQALMGS